MDEHCKFQNMRKTDPFMWPHAGISAKGTAAPGSAPDCKFLSKSFGSCIEPKYRTTFPVLSMIFTNYVNALPP